MNPAQTSLYFREWGAVRKHYLTNGIDPKQADAKRHELHRKALGEMKSSKDFTNLDLDKVLGVFRAITQPANLNAQLRQLDQPEQRAAAALRRAQDLTVSLGIVDPGRENNYLRGIATKVFQNDDIFALSAEQLQQIIGMLYRRRKQLENAQQRQCKQPVGALHKPTGENPF
jgi:Protein of unknown function (DUF1018)